MILTDLFIYLLIILFTIRTIKNILYHAYIWQLKEYRLDRMIAHLKTPQGGKWMFGPLAILKWILLCINIFLFLGFSFGDNLSLFFFILPQYVYLFEGTKNIYDLVKKRWRLPVFTPKAIFTSLFALIFTSFIIKWSWDLNSDGTLLLVAFLVSDKLMSPIITLLILLFNIPKYIYKKILLTSAKRKILSLNNLVTIGITGSYGKTSTKEFLATILSEKFKVAKTPEFTNTDIGIAKFILKELKPEREIFVVEIGAYKKGEIRAICDMVNPKIGIITGINAQHLELFGSIENTMKAKFELIESLPKDGAAIFKGNNNQCLEMAQWAKEGELKVSTYNTASDVKAIKIFTDHIEFSLTDNNKSYHFSVNLLGIQSLENLLAAINAAKSLGMNLDEIQKGASKIISPIQTMQLVGKIKGTTLIDDSFNANPDGVLAAIEYMKIYKGKKILVLTPLIELGQESEKTHELLGEQIAAVCDLILLTNPNYYSSFIKGVKKVGTEGKVQVVNAMAGTKLVNEILGKDGVIVFEGKESGKILERLRTSR